MNLFPKERKPYFICAPSYTHISSGVRTLHLLCHALNECGEKAYLIPNRPDGYATNPFLNTPLPLPQHYNFYGDSPIVIYPDVIRGNPLNAKRVVRMLLAPAGKYGGDSVFPETDQIWGALPSIAVNILRIPASDTGIFWRSPFPSRSGSCFYSHKYDKIHGNNLMPITDGMVRLEGTLEDLADILRSSEACYLYEPTSVITEAALCGCPVTLIRSPYFSAIDPASMMGEAMWSDGEVVKKCDNYLPEYMRHIENFEFQLENFIEKTQGIL